uniref:Uncharacterized protein n=1 Tax=Arundo donax TaxID=35708 RepID=A0A0A9BPX3_ARUDO
MLKSFSFSRHHDSAVFLFYRSQRSKEVLLWKYLSPFLLQALVSKYHTHRQLQLPVPASNTMSPQHLHFHAIEDAQARLPTITRFHDIIHFTELFHHHHHLRCPVASFGCHGSSVRGILPWRRAASRTRRR